MLGVTAGIVVVATLLIGTREGSAYLLDGNCGISDPVTFRIAGGKETSTYQNPWMVQVISRNWLNHTMCSGSLISSRFVLTAAHCPIYSYTYVLLGDHLTEDPKIGCSSENCIPKSYIIDVDKKIIHQNYTGGARKFDIALLRMTSEVTYSDFVRPICLLVGEQLADVSAFKVTGWGNTKNQETSPRLLTASVQDDGRWFCEMKYRLQIDESQLCAGSHTSRTCVGDSGGPLSAERSYGGILRVFQYGLVSYGPQNCTDTIGTPSVYTRVSYYMEWIMDRIRVFGSFPSDVGANKETASLNDEICGTTKRHLRARRVVGGHDAERFASPWMVMVFSENDFRCGGSLITSRFVLTSGVCSSGPPHSIKVRLGGYHMTVTENTFDINIDRMIPHPQFGSPGFRYDIGLLRMAQKVSFSDYIRPICLAVNVNHQLGTISRFEAHGWGATRRSDNHRSGYLQSTILNNLGLSDCIRYLIEQMDQSQICAGSNTSDTCGGDAGGPLSGKLFYKGTNRVFQFGIVSYGSLSCDAPSVYTNVTHYLNWIKDKIEEY